MCGGGTLGLHVDFRTPAEKDDEVCRVAFMHYLGELRAAAAAQPVNCRARTFQSTLPDKARESWQQQLDLALARLPWLTSVCLKALVAPSGRAVAHPLPSQAGFRERGAERRLCSGK